MLVEVDNLAAQVAPLLAVLEGGVLVMEVMDQPILEVVVVDQKVVLVALVEKELLLSDILYPLHYLLEEL